MAIKQNNITPSLYVLGVTSVSNKQLIHSLALVISFSKSVILFLAKSLLAPTMSSKFGIDPQHNPHIVVEDLTGSVGCSTRAREYIALMLGDAVLLYCSRYIKGGMSATSNIIDIVH